MIGRLLGLGALAVGFAAPLRADTASGPRGCVPSDVTRVLQSYSEQTRQQNERIQRLYRSMIVQGKDELHSALTSEVVDQRFMAVYVAGDRGLPWREEFIGLLTDSAEPVRQAARRGLIILCHLTLNPDEVSMVDSTGRNRPAPPTPVEPLSAPVDFGPLAGAPLSAQKRAVGQWIEWWTESRPISGRGIGQPRVPPEFDVDADSRHLSAPLIIAGPDRRKELIALFRNAEGSGYTEALAVAIAQSSLDARDELRDALATRMTRVTDETLRRRLDERLAEVRRAAIVELVRRESRAQMVRVTALLLDPEPEVQRAAHAALCQLSGQDFGPKANATQEERTQAVARWEKWWAGKTPR